MTLADNGKGIAPADRERIVDPFFTTKREHGGTGLGLPIARALVGGKRGSPELADGTESTQFALRLLLAHW